jgi:hypothetical protein
MPTNPLRALPGCAALAAAVAAAAPAHASLQPSQVLVVYDSRNPEGLRIAEHYAGSDRVPGGLGNVFGLRRGVRILDLAAVGAAPMPADGTVSPAFFQTNIRDPIRARIEADNLVRQTRCLVLVKGVPHRVQDSDNANVGDAPATFVTEFNAGDVTCASVDSELTLLWQDLSAGEAGAAGDSFADGRIRNPFWRVTTPINNTDTTNIRTPKALTANGSPGQLWNFGPTGPARLTAGDIVLVARLDGPSAAVVNASLDRAQRFLYDVNTSAIVLDEANSDGIVSGANDELDNQGAAQIRAGDDYERARDQTLADGRWNPALVRYDALANAANFSVGPLLDYAGQGLLITQPLVLLAHAGNNHAGSKPTGPAGNAGSTYAASFHYADGAIFNTIESFNGRAFGSLGTLAGQEQLSDFLAAGGTFGIGHVWEPLADAIPDNEFLLREFVLGDLSWAEAAWKSIPVLSWMHVVVGDPLARAQRTSEDINADGTVDIDDLYAWEQAPQDINRDGNADQTDRDLVERAIRRTGFEDLGGRVR